MRLAVIPTNGSPYNEPGKEVSSDDTGSFTFDLGGACSIDGLLATVDNNDTYVFDLCNGAALAGHLVIGASEGSVGNGVETFTRFFGPVTATSATVSAGGGDHLNALGEVQFRSSALTPAAVPEPATWAMMLLGFGGIGFHARRRRRALNVQAA